MVRDRAKSRGDALAYEFEGRQTSFAEFDIKTNRVANALDRDGRQEGRAHRLSRQEQRLLFRTADGRDEGRRGDGAGELAPRRPRGRLHRRRLQGAGAVRRPRIRHPGAQHQGQAARAFAPSSRPRAARRNGPIILALARRAERRRSDGRDRARRTSRSSSTPRARPASPRARCCRTPTSSTSCRAGNEAESSRTGTSGLTDDVSLVAMPIFHIGGSGWGVMGLYHGARGVIAREFDPTKVLGFLRAVRHHQAVHGAGRDAVRGAAAARAAGRFLAG